MSNLISTLSERFSDMGNSSWNNTYSCLFLNLIWFLSFSDHSTCGLSNGHKQRRIGCYKFRVSPDHTLNGFMGLFDFLFMDWTLPALTALVIYAIFPDFRK
nr:hypothetical protein [Streptococcus infantis]